MKHCTILTLFLSVFVMGSMAQSVNDLGWFRDSYTDQTYIGLGLNHTWISNDEAPNPDAHKRSGWTVKLESRKITYEQWKSSRYWEHKMFGDIINYYANYRKGDASIYVSESSHISTGLFGWWSWVWNVTKPGRFSAAGGLNLNDFFLHSSYVKDENSQYDRISNKTRIEPNGYYFATGPSIRMNYMITSGIQLEYFGSLSIPFGRVTPEDFENQNDDYPNPFFLNNNVEIISSYGFYAGFSFTDIINRGDNPNSSMRRDAYLGFRIKL
ncbi:hypothetical protein [Salibacter halophilus]|uniref:Uncharacterized protein n=1 Tax=Salibacter halophilus TaxID=1803916 RepID=A0A6N6M9H6_9FLAO|nr:hypothetical protein [Salibacter halophilus]KAB1064872.1 hypothetical protein F3059_05815 [Salibacter halophilus]